ncbi:hypothetical protein LINPERPRIM_LOCUS22936 [Linum perenne]
MLPGVLTHPTPILALLRLDS